MKVAVYARFNNQKAELLARTGREGWDFQYFEEQETPRGTRPVKYRLYQRLLKKEFDAVIVWDLNAWAQSFNELIPEIDRLYKRDVKFITLKTSIDLTNELARYQYQIIRDFAEFQKKLASDKIKEKFFTDKDGITRSKKTKKAVGLRGKDKRKRRKAGYYNRWAKKTIVVNSMFFLIGKFRLKLLYNQVIYKGV